MSSDEFSHSDSYKDYINNVLQAIQDKNVKDPVWGNKIPSNYEELKQYCLQYIDEYSTPPGIVPSPIPPMKGPYSSIFAAVEPKSYLEEVTAQVRIRHLRDLVAYFRSNVDIALEAAQDQCDLHSDEYLQEIEPYSSLSEKELTDMCISDLYSRSEHHLLSYVVSEYIRSIPYAKTNELTTLFAYTFLKNHPEPYGQLPPLASNESDTTLNELASWFDIPTNVAQSEILYQANKLFVSSSEKSVTWNVLCISDQISDPAASGVQFKLYAAKAGVNLKKQEFDFVLPHRQLHFLTHVTPDENDEILKGEESFLHIASAQVVHQRIAPTTAPQRQAGIAKLRYLKTQTLRQTVMSTVNWMVSVLKSAELDIRDSLDKSCLEDATKLFERSVYVESKQFPHCIVVRDPSTSRNIIFEETHELMNAIRNELIEFGTFYINRWEREYGPQIDRKAIVEDLYECEYSYQNAKKELVDALLEIGKNTFKVEEQQRYVDLLKYIIMSRPVLNLEVYDYLRVPFDINTRILKIQARVLSSGIVKTIDDVEMLLRAAKDSVLVTALKQGTLCVDALVNIEFLIWQQIEDFLSNLDGHFALSKLIENIELNHRVASLLEPGQPVTQEDVKLFARKQTVRCEVMRTLIGYNAYRSQCLALNEECHQTLEKTLFHDLTGENEGTGTGFVLAVDEVKYGHVELSGQGLEVILKCQAVESSLFEAVISHNFNKIERKYRLETLEGFPEKYKVPAVYSRFFDIEALKKEITEYQSFQSIEKLKGTIRESLQVMNLNAGSHFDEILSAHIKQSNTNVQFLSNRSRLPDVLYMLSLYSNGDSRVPAPAESNSIVESVQPSMRREKVRSSLEFYTLVLNCAFLSFMAHSLDKPCSKLVKKRRKMVFASPDLGPLLDECAGLHSDSQKCLAAKTHASSLLLRIHVACLSTCMEHPEGVKVIKSKKQMASLVPTLPEELEEEMNLVEEVEKNLVTLSFSLSNIYAIFLQKVPQELRSQIKTQFDSLSSTTLPQSYVALRQKCLLIRLLSSPTLSPSAHFPFPFRHLLTVADGLLSSSPLRSTLLRILLQRPLSPTTPQEPSKPLPKITLTEKTPFLADVDSLPLSTPSSSLHSSVALFLSSLQMSSPTSTPSELKISQADVNRSLLKFSASLSRLMNSSLASSHKAFLKLSQILAEKQNSLNQSLQTLAQTASRESRALPRRLSASLADRSHSLGFEIALLKESLSSQSDRTLRHQAIRRALREEYAPRVRQYAMTLFSLRHNLEQHQKTLQREIESSMFDIKRETVQALLKSPSLPDEVRESMRQAFEEDDRLHKMLGEKSDASAAVFKLRALKLLQDMQTKSEFQNRLKTVEEAREAVRAEAIQFSRERDVREAAMRQQFAAVGQSVREAEKEVERLRRELELENRNRAKLRDWRVAHEKKREHLEKKLKRLEEWSRYKPDKLIFELEEIEREIERRKRGRERVPELINRTKETVERELNRAKKVLKDVENRSERVVEWRVQEGEEEMRGDWAAVREENEELKAENEKLRERVAELGLQMSAVGQTTINGIKIRASRRDGLN